MKTQIIYLSAILSLFALETNAQVGIATTNPQQMLHVDGTAAGLQTIRVDDIAVTAGGTNPGELATTTSTTNKALYADTNGDIRVRYVYGDNNQSVILPSGTQNITSTSLTDINWSDNNFYTKTFCCIFIFCH